MVQKAKPIIKNKFWIVEEDGKKVATIQASPMGVVLVQGTKREIFPSFKILSSKYNIRVSSNADPVEPNTADVYSVYDYPCDSFPHNPIYDLKLRLPLFTKETSSKSFHCAGYYLVNIDDKWESVFCPKKIMLTRHTFFGPYNSSAELDNKLSQLTVNCN